MGIGNDVTVGTVVIPPVDNRLEFQTGATDDGVHCIYLQVDTFREEVYFAKRTGNHIGNKWLNAR